MQKEFKCSICRGQLHDDSDHFLMIEGVVLCDGCAADVCTLKKRLGGTRNPGVHAAHCCKIHGCKYGYDDCVVFAGDVEQEFPCESCQEQDSESGTREQEWELWLHKKLDDPEFVAKLKKVLKVK